jgi:sn-glycerol 3-phosphate transport system permease protein
MVEKTPWLDLMTYTLLILGIGIVGFPIFYTIIAATLPVELVARRSEERRVGKECKA